MPPSLHSKASLQTMKIEDTAQVATACAATVKALTVRQERLANSLSLVKGTASLADAKCAALGAEIAKLYRDSGHKRAAHSGSSGKKVPRMPLAG